MRLQAFASGIPIRCSASATSLSPRPSRVKGPRTRGRRLAVSRTGEGRWCSATATVTTATGSTGNATAEAVLAALHPTALLRGLGPTGCFKPCGGFDHNIYIAF